MKVHETNDGSKMMRRQTTIDEKALEISALKINKEYEEKVELGKALYKILNKGVVQEESFPPEWQKALDLYLKQGHQIDPETVVLKPWQMELMKHIDNPSDRKILWVQGEKCGEGKTWFQKYVQSLLGRRRVVAGGINIHSNSASIAHALKKQRTLLRKTNYLMHVLMMVGISSRRLKVSGKQNRS